MQIVTGSSQPITALTLNISLPTVKILAQKAENGIASIDSVRKLIRLTVSLLFVKNCGMSELQMIQVRTKMTKEMKLNSIITTSLEPLNVE